MGQSIRFHGAILCDHTLHIAKYCLSRSPTLRLVDKVSRSCGHTPGKVAGQRATVKAEMNGVTPGLDRRPP
ncbi:hypothetical protein FVD04_10220, partial [Campylobacter jejuni]|nr:hypothetical protein [Campylobacter jejuni]